ncbi:MAG: hypothetical protein AMXMBFR23_01470 [Chloroflexota bacterium]
MTQEAPIPPARRYPATEAFPTGPAVGAAFPAITLRDQYGEPIRLPEASDGRPALVVFHRSARWCAFCRTQLRHLQEHLPAFEAAGVALYAVSYDSVPTLAEFSGLEGIGYPLLSDEGSVLIRALGILNDLVLPEEDVYGIPYPGAYALDGAGRVTHKFFFRHYRDRIAPLAVLRETFGADVDLSACPRVEASAGGLRVRAVLGDTSLVPHQHTPCYVSISPTRPATVRITADDVEAGTPYPSGDEIAVPLLLTSLERDRATLHLEVTPEGGEAVTLDLTVPVPGLNRSSPAR